MAGARKSEGKVRRRPIPPLGPGLFIDSRAQKGAARADSEIHRFLDEAKVVVGTHEWLQAQLLEIARLYWAAHNYETQESFGFVKAELEAAHAPLKIAMRKIRKLPKQAKLAINIELVERRREREFTDHIAAACAQVALIESAIEEITSKTYVKGSARRFADTLTRVASLWERLTGGGFARTKTTASGHAGANEFVNTATRFVFVVMQAIDPAVTIANVSSALQQPNQAEPEEFSSSKTSR